MNRKVIGIIVFFVLVIGGSIGFYYYWVQSKIEKNVITASGNIEAVEVNVGTEIAGKIKELKAEEGDRVEKGQELARLDDTLLKAQYDQAKATLQLAQTQLNPLQLAQAQASFNLAELNLKRAIITAPVTGTIVSRPVEVGEIVSPGATLYVIANLDRVNLVVYLPQKELGKIKRGKRVKVKVDSFPDRIFTGKISKIASQAEFTPTNVQTEEQRLDLVFAVTITINNKNHDLKPGLPADVEIPI